MKVALLSGASSIHTIRWANGLSSAGLEVHVISQHPPVEKLSSNVILHLLPYRGVLGYFLMVPSVKKILKNISPDIVNAHYASGYATTARLVGRRPWILSVWGTDVYDFPYKSIFHMWLVKKNIKSADAVASTSHCMAEHTKGLAPELDDINITPFGVDLSGFSSIKRKPGSASDKITIGTVKTMSHNYGIDLLLKAFADVCKKIELDGTYSFVDLKLRLVGDGADIGSLKVLAAELGIADKVSFVGRVNHENVPGELEKLDIYVALSRKESFGVAIIEAGAAGRPVVVSDAGGLPEVVVNGKTGLVVPGESPEMAAEAILKLVKDRLLMKRMGELARQHVSKNYSWDASVEKMVDLYKRVISERIKAG
ncbi:glycosyltransferase [Halomonas salifodinae]|uniref:glycosyltransferase n=1 Tax=Halomonas salifodinae TaxID=438745 RepID=UPI0033AA554B